tara:strand:+ start:50317 stop:50598 length:282 start_codon:yes stop_codon:yes gene_type:complete
MKNNSSNSNMEDILNQLQAIKKVEPNPSLFSKIEARIDRTKTSTISMIWVRAAAAVLLCLVTTEFYFILDKSKTTKEDIELIAPTTNNIISYE